MKTTRRLEVLAALAVGCAAGWGLCSAVGCGTARADEEAQIVQVKCVDGVATYEAPGRSAADLALGVKPIKKSGSTPGAYEEDVEVSGINWADGRVTLACLGLNAETRVLMLAVR